VLEERGNRQIRVRVNQHSADHGFFRFFAVRRGEIVHQDTRRIVYHRKQIALSQVAGMRLVRLDYAGRVVESANGAALAGCRTV
jgi:hypothetical protein